MTEKETEIQGGGNEGEGERDGESEDIRRVCFLIEPLSASVLRQDKGKGKGRGKPKAPPALGPGGAVSADAVTELEEYTKAAIDEIRHGIQQPGEQCNKIFLLLRRLLQSGQ